MTIQEIRDYLGQFLDAGELVGSDDGLISGPAKIETAQKGQFTFIANEKYTRFLVSTRASLVIVHRSLCVDEFVHTTVFLKVDDPYTAFVFLMQKFAQPRSIAAKGIASTVVIGEAVSIGEGVAIGEYAVIGDDDGDHGRLPTAINCVLRTMRSTLSSVFKPAISSSGTQRKSLDSALICRGRERSARSA